LARIMAAAVGIQRLTTWVMEWLIYAYVLNVVSFFQDFLIRLNTNFSSSWCVLCAPPTLTFRPCAVGPL
jgi:hypothetical protein